MEPFTVEQIPPAPPTEAQLNYARDLGLKIPFNATKEDVSAILSACLDYNYDSRASQDLIDYANDQKLLFSKYIGESALYDLIFREISEEERIAFFVFCVYRSVSNDKSENLSRHPKKNVFYAFASHKKNDDRFLRSMYGYIGAGLVLFGTIIDSEGMEYEGGSTSTIAYKEVCDYLKSKLDIAVSKKTHRFDLKHKSTSSPKAISNSGTDYTGDSVTGCSCLVVLVLFVIAILIWAC